MYYYEKRNGVINDLGNSWEYICLRIINCSDKVIKAQRQGIKFIVLWTIEVKKKTKK